MLDRNLVLPHRLIEQAGRTPDRPLMMDVDGRVLTYAETIDAMYAWAGAWRAIGVQPRENVVTMLPNSFESYLSWLGLSWLRAVEVPTNNMYLGRMLEYLVERPNQLVTKAALLSDRQDSLYQTVVGLVRLEATNAFLEWEAATTRMKMPFSNSRRFAADFSL